MAIKILIECNENGYKLNELIYVLTELYHNICIQNSLNRRNKIIPFYYAI